MLGKSKTFPDGQYQDIFKLEVIILKISILLELEQVMSSCPSVNQQPYFRMELMAQTISSTYRNGKMRVRRFFKFTLIQGKSTRSLMQNTTTKRLISVIIQNPTGGSFKRRRRKLCFIQRACEC